MAKFNLKLHENEGIPEAWETELRKERERQKLTADSDVITDKLIEEKRKNKDKKSEYERLLDDARTLQNDKETIEAAIDNRKVEDGVPQRNYQNKRDCLPLNLLDSASDTQIDKIFNFSKEKDKTDSMHIKKIPSQLANVNERFEDLTVEDVKNNKEVKRLVSASIKDADAMLFHIYSIASKEQREITQEEKNIIDSINLDKTKLLGILLNAL